MTILGRIFWICFGIYLAACSQQESTVSNADSPIFELIAAQDDFSGHVLIAKEDDIIFDEAFGLADNTRAMTTDERWRWASVTKQIVAVAILQLVEENKLTLDTTVEDILPDITIPTAKDITVQHLLQHASGLSNPNDIPAETYRAGVDPNDYCRSPVKSDPGQKFEYNNCDFVILGEIIEALDQKPWFESLQERIFSPLNITGVKFDTENGDETVRGYATTDTPAPDIALHLYDAAGGLVGTANDLLTFNKGLISGALLAPETRERLWTPNPALNYTAMGQWAYVVNIEGCDGSVKIVERLGAILGIQVQNLILPELDSSIIIFTNRDDFDFGSIWSSAGFSYDMISHVACGG